MTYSPIIKVDISINATPLTQEGFGTPLFISAHRQFQERVRSYSSVAEVQTDFASDSNAVKAAQKVFAQSPTVSQFMVGRADVKASITPAAPTADGESYQFSITLDETGYSTTLSYNVTSFSTEDAQDVADSWKASIEADPNLASEVTAVVVGTGASAVLEISGQAADTYFEVADFTSNGSSVYVANESAEETLSAIEEENNDWYFITAEDHSNSYVLAMAQAASARDTIYFVSSNDVANLTSYQAGNTDLFAQLRDGNFKNVVTLFHHDADDFVELAYIGANAPYDAGSVTWANLQLNGVGFSQSPTNGRPLTSTQKGNLNDKNANYVELDAGISYTRTGITAGGEWIDVIRGVSWQTADMSTSLRALLVNQKGGKVSYNDQGIAQIREVISSSLQRGVNREFLDSYTVSVPLLKDTSQLDRLARILTGVSFEGILAGAIHEVIVVGSVTV